MRIQRALHEERHQISRRRIGRLMRELGLQGMPRRRFRVTTQADARLPVAPNHLARQFMVERPNRVWATDITYCATGEGWLYLAVVLELCSRRVVGWATRASLDRKLVQVALDRALAVRQPATGLLCHSDRGSQYACRDYQAQLSARGIVCSMSRKGDCWDNAVLESFFATLKRELVHRDPWSTRGALTRALAAYIDGWYNPERQHSTLGYLSPIAFERQLNRAA